MEPDTRLTPPPGAVKLTPLQMNNLHFKIAGRHTAVADAPDRKKSN